MHPAHGGGHLCNGGGQRKRPAMAANAAHLASLLHSQPGFVWLDGDGSRRGRRSYLGCRPSEVVCIDYGHPDPLYELHRLDPEGTWIGYIAYDAVWSGGGLRGQQRLPRRTEPVIWFARYDALIEIDHVAHTTRFTGPNAEHLKALVDRATPRSASCEIGPLEATDAAKHRDAIDEALRLIAAGEIYQVNLSRCWTAALKGDAFSLWTRMRTASPVPLGFYLDAGDHQVLGRTMETFLEWRRANGRLFTQPIKGTVARAGNDSEEAAALRSNPKEHAEHAMIVDLMRNDLSRVATTGSVRVEEAFQVEPFAGLHHMVSTVACHTDASPAEILVQTFPPGSVTGTPKVRAIEIIEALENTPRGVYTGCVGIIAPERLSMAVAIRTASVRGGRLRYYAGGGIVEASDPDREIAETELKARALLDAL